MTDKPSEAAIREACRRAGITREAADIVRDGGINRALTLAASLIEKFEPDTLIDPYLKRAREICAEEYASTRHDINARRCLAGDFDCTHEMRAIIRALKEGMPK